MCVGGYVNGSRVDEVIMCKHEGNSLNAIQVYGGGEDSSGPTARASVSCALNGRDVFMFGGQENDNRKMNDLWSFNIDEKCWSQIELGADDYKPCPRSGHSTVVHGEKMYIFGGLLELTKELNDLVVFDFETKKFSSNGSGDEENEDRDNIEHSPNLVSKDTSPLKKTKTMGASNSRSPTKRND